MSRFAGEQGTPINKKVTQAGSGLRRNLKHIDDLNKEFPETLWVTLLRMYYKPVFMVRQHKGTIEPMLDHGFFGDRMWRVGSKIISEQEAIEHAEKIRTSKREPQWGTLDKRFGCEFSQLNGDE